MCAYSGLPETNFSGASNFYFLKNEVSLDEETVEL
jgi:hypothetical protein